MFICTDVTVTNDQFIIGSRAVANCTSIADLSAIDSITWTNSAGEVVARTDSASLLQLVFDPVNDSLALQGEEFNCTVSGGAAVARQSFQVSLISK